MKEQTSNHLSDCGLLFCFENEESVSDKINGWLSRHVYLAMDRSNTNTFPISIFSLGYLTLIVLICHHTQSENSTPTYDIECDNNYSCGIFNPLLSTKKPEEWTYDDQQTSRIKKFETKVQLRLKKIPDLIFDTYSNLITLKMEEAGIEILPEHHFAKSQVLKNLILNSNQIQVIPTHAFEGLKEIIYMEIMNNKIELIEANAFDGLLTLELLDLSGNKIKHITESTIIGAKYLKFLNLNENELELIDDGALNLPNMEGMNLRRNRLATLPTDICGVSPKLRYLHLSVNHLTSVNMEFDACRNLKILYLDNNRLETINFTSLAYLDNLHILQLGYNSIKLPETPPTEAAIQNSKSVLETLPMEFNQLSNPDIFKHAALFKNIERISLRGNAFTGFNDPGQIFAMLPKLKHISFDRNPDMEKWLDENKSLLFDNNIAVVMN